MGINIGIYRDAAFTDELSSGKNPGEAGYNPVFKGETFNGDTGEAKNRVLYVYEKNQTKNLFYQSVQTRFVVVTTGARDPDNDDVDEIHGYCAKPVETTVTDESVGTGNGSQTVFSLARKFVKPGSEVIKLGSTVQERGVDYFINYLNGKIKFAVAPANGVAVTASYVHGDNGSGSVNIPSDALIEANGDFTYADVWDIPHGEDANRAAGYEKDGIPIIIRAKVDANTKDPDGDAVTITGIDIEVKGTEVAGKY